MQPQESVDNTVGYVRARVFQFVLYPIIVIAVTAGIGWNISVAKDLATLKEKATQQNEIVLAVKKLKEDVQEIKISAARLDVKQENISANIQRILTELRTGNSP